MPIREMLYYIYMSDGFGGDAVNPASRARVSGWVPAGLAGASSLQFEFAWAVVPRRIREARLSRPGMNHPWPIQ